MIQSPKSGGDARSLPIGQTTSGPPEPREKGDSPMATDHTIRGQIVVHVPGIDPAGIPGLLQLLVSTVRGPERWDILSSRMSRAQAHVPV
jgi:hypothetical protein